MGQPIGHHGKSPFGKGALFGIGSLEHEKNTDLSVKLTHVCRGGKKLRNDLFPSIRKVSR